MLTKHRISPNGHKVTLIQRFQIVKFSESAIRKGEFLSSFSLHPLVRKTYWPTVLVAFGLFIIFFIFLALVQFATPNLAGNDGYYHIKLAYLMRTQGLKPDFNWLPLTILNAREFADHHFLYHVLLIPFTFGDLRLGAKLASVFYPAISFLIIWWFLRERKVPFASFWAIGMLTISEAFIYRMSMPRVQSLSLGVLILALHFLLNRKYRWLLPLAFFYVWLYDAFPLLLIVTGIYAIANWLLKGELEWRPVFYTGSGIALGILVNPYFPDNLIFIFRHILPKLAEPTATHVGSEWYPYKTTQLIENSGVALTAFVVGIIALGLHARRINIPTLTSLLLTFVFGAMVFQSRRFIEYFPPFILIFTAFSISPLIEQWMTKKKSQRSRPGIILALVMLLPLLWLTVQESRKSMQGSKPYQRYSEAAGWLEANTPTGSRVFQTDWDDFPRLFYYNTHNTYTLGLDPTYMELQNADLYDLWVDITKGRVEDPSGLIRQLFGTTYIFSDLKHKSFMTIAQEDPNLLEIYRSEDAVIFKIVDY